MAARVLDPIGVMMNMKKLISLLLAICIVLALVSCRNRDSNGELHIETPPSVTSPVGMEQQEEVNRQEEISEASYEPFEGKIAIINYGPGSGFADSEIAWLLAKEFGEDRLILMEWREPEIAIERIRLLANDPDVRAIVAFSPPVWVPTEAFIELREEREDIFLIFCFLWKPSSEEQIAMAQLADLVLITDEEGMDFSIAQQAQRLGASTVVFYERPRSSPFPFLPERRERMELKSDEIGIQFAEHVAMEKRDSANNPLILEGFINDFIKAIEEYDKDIAIYNANIPPRDLLNLINAAAETDVILICHLYHFIAASLGVIPDFNFYDILPPEEEYIYKIRAIFAEKNMAGRISAWSVPDSWVNIYASVQYAIKWINGEVPREGIDVDALRQLMEDFALVDVKLTPFVEEGTGQTFDNFFMVLMDFITF